jgi:hypothetical protein
MSEAFDLQYVLCIYKDKSAPHDRWAYGIHDDHFHEIVIVDKDLDDIPERLHKALTAKNVEEPNTKPNEKDTVWTTRLTLSIDKRFDNVRSIGMFLSKFGFSQCYNAEISEDFHRYTWERVGETVDDVRKLLYDQLVAITMSKVTPMTLCSMFNYIMRDLPHAYEIKDGYLNICSDGIGIIDLSVDICKE